MFFPSLNTGIVGLLVSFAGAGIFSAYLVFDTWRISQELDVDDYVEGAIQLYMDCGRETVYIDLSAVWLKTDSSVGMCGDFDLWEPLAICRYLQDIVNLFLYILEILMQLSKGDSRD